MSSFIKRIFESHSGVSSKRVFGAIGFITCVGISIYCTIVDKQSPTIVDSLLYSSLALLGIDSITGIWKFKPKNNETNSRSD